MHNLSTQLQLSEIEVQVPVKAVAAFVSQCDSEPTHLHCILSAQSIN